MPIPVHAASYQVQVVFPALSADPADVFTNTLYFVDAAATPRSLTTVAGFLKTKLDGFYGTAQGGAASPIKTYMSRAIDWTNIKYKVYDLGQTPPRVPDVRTATLSAPGSATGLPNEVSLVLSFRTGAGTTGGGSSDPTKRGRIYIGPLQVGAISFTVGVDEDAKPAAALIDSVVKAATWLKNTHTDDLIWQQYSRKLDAMDDVDGGFVNNDFDTQRRRGVRASSRTTF